MKDTVLEKNVELTDEQIQQYFDTYDIDYSRLDYNLTIEWIKSHWEPEVDFSNLRTSAYWFDQEKKMFGLRLVRFEKEDHVIVLELLFTGPILTVWSSDKKLIKDLFGAVDQVPMQIATWIMSDEDFEKIYLPRNGSQ